MSPNALKYHCSCLFLGMFLLSSSLSLLASPPTDSSELLEYLITQNEAARAKIRSFSCSLDITQNGRTRTAQLKQQGSCRWLASNQPAKTGPVAGFQTRMVVNDRYMAEYALPIPRSVMSYANWRDYDSFYTMDNETKRRIQTNTPDDFFVHCFGNRSESFRWSMTRRPDIRWDAVQTTDTDGRTVYQIRRFGSRSNLPYPDAVWVVDPDKGFLATETFAYSGGRIFLHRAMQVEQVADNVWFPISFQQENYRQGYKPVPYLSNWESVIARDLAVNTDIPPEQFEFDALHLWEDAPDVIVLRFQTDGTKIPYVYDNTGQLIPQRERDRQNAALENDKIVKNAAEVSSRKSEESLQEKLNISIDLSIMKRGGPVSEAIAHIQNSFDPPLPILVDWDDLKANAGVVSSDKARPGNYIKAPAGEALHLLLYYVSKEKKPIDYIIENDKILIKTNPYRLVEKTYTLDPALKYDVSGIPLSFYQIRELLRSQLSPLIYPEKRPRDHRGIFFTDNQLTDNRFIVVAEEDKQEQIAQKLANLEPVDLREIRMSVRAFAVDKDFLKDIGINASKTKGTLVTVPLDSQQMVSVLKREKLDAMDIPFDEFETLDGGQEYSMMQAAQARMGVRMLKSIQVEFPNNYEARTNVSRYCLTQDISCLQKGTPEPIQYIQIAVIRDDGDHLAYKANYLFLNILKNENYRSMNDEGKTAVEIAELSINTIIVNNKTFLVIGPELSVDTHGNQCLIKDKEQLVILITPTIVPPEPVKTPDTPALRPERQTDGEIAASDSTEKGSRLPMQYLASDDDGKVERYHWRLNLLCPARLTRQMLIIEGDTVRGYWGSTDGTFMESEQGINFIDYQLIITKEGDQFDYLMRDCSSAEGVTGYDVPASNFRKQIALPECDRIRTYLLNEPDEVNEQYLPLWRRDFIKDGHVMKTLLYAVRIAADDDNPPFVPTISTIRDNQQQMKEITPARSNRQTEGETNQQDDSDPKEQLRQQQPHTPLPPPGRGALRFDGIDDFLHVQAAHSLALDGPFTVQIWIKPEFPDIASPDKTRNLLSKGGYVVGAPAADTNRQADAYGFAVTLKSDENDRMLVDSVTGKGGLYSQTLVLPQSQDWTHLALKFDGPSAQYDPAPKSDLIIGGQYLIPTGHFYQGLIGELRIWNRLLTPDEIALYEKTALTGSEPNLAACWTFEAPGQDPPDISPNRNRARLGTAFIPDNSDPTWVPVDHESIQVTGYNF